MCEQFCAAIAVMQSCHALTGKWVVSKKIYTPYGENGKWPGQIASCDMTFNNTRIYLTLKNLLYQLTMSVNAKYCLRIKNLIDLGRIWTDHIFKNIYAYMDSVNSLREYLVHLNWIK